MPGYGFTSSAIVLPLLSMVTLTPVLQSLPGWEPVKTYKAKSTGTPDHVKGSS